MQSAIALEGPVETAGDLSTSAGDQESPRKALDDLITRALAYRTGPELKALFDFMKRFPHLAPYNAMLLHIQNPKIQFALRAPVWERKYERRVITEARPYVILQTMGPVAFVFDLCDTKPINPKRDLIPETITNPFAASGQPPRGALKRLIVACLKIGIVVQEQDLATYHAGSAIQFSGGTFGVSLNSKHTEAQHIGTLAHELGHVFCGHLGAVKEGFWPDNSSAPKM
jgi:IrrE N-terminal-like domain